MCQRELLSRGHYRMAFLISSLRYWTHKLLRREGRTAFHFHRKILLNNNGDNKKVERRGLNVNCGALLFNYRGGR